MREEEWKGAGALWVTVIECNWGRGGGEREKRGLPLGAAFPQRVYIRKAPRGRENIGTDKARVKTKPVDLAESLG